MRLECIGTDGKPFTVDVGSVRIVSEQGTIFAVATEWGPGQVFMAQAGEPGFNRMLANLGIDRATIVRELPAEKLKA